MSAYNVFKKLAAKLRDLAEDERRIRTLTDDHIEGAVVDAKIDVYANVARLIEEAIKEAL